MILFKFHQHAVQILIKECMERLQTFNISIINGNIKCLIGKSIFAVNLPLKLFRATIANADIESLKFLHTFLAKCLYHMLVKFEQIRIVQIARNFEVFDKKTGFFFKSFLTSADDIL